MKILSYVQYIRYDDADSHKFVRLEFHYGESAALNTFRLCLIMERHEN